jgi:Fur family transcriptional regulator, ferric uptake regulator
MRLPAGRVAAIHVDGRRVTRQRRSIWKAVVEGPGAHFSAAELAEAVRAEGPKVHQATVYRTLDLLVETGLLLKTDLGGERSYYELPAEHRHHHVICTACERVVHVHDASIEAAIEAIEAAIGFRLGRNELHFSGECPNCSSG